MAFKPPSPLNNRNRLVLLFALLMLTGCGHPEGTNASGAVASRVRHGIRLALSGSQQSTNWCGYQVTGLPLGFNQVRGRWIVPAIEGSGSQTASATWAGVGGGCADPPTCAADDVTLIQAGTEQDFYAGAPHYSAWWEAIPAPSVNASGGLLSKKKFPVLPGDQITVTIDGSDLVVWNIEIKSVRDNLPKWTFTTTVPYTAAGVTAEWIEELPLVFGSNGTRPIGLSNFGQIGFGGLQVNGAAPVLDGQDAIVLVNAKNQVIASPSQPMAGPSFDVCYGAAACE